jgi:hypothetical protein
VGKKLRKKLAEKKLFLPSTPLRPVRFRFWGISTGGTGKNIP